MKNVYKVILTDNNGKEDVREYSKNENDAINARTAKAQFGIVKKNINNEKYKDIVEILLVNETVKKNGTARVILDKFEHISKEIYIEKINFFLDDNLESFYSTEGTQHFDLPNFLGKFIVEKQPFLEFYNFSVGQKITAKIGDEVIDEYIIVDNKKEKLKEKVIKEKVIKEKQIELKEGSVKDLMQKKVDRINDMVGGLSQVQKKYMGKNLIESMDAVLNVYKTIIGHKPIYKKDSTGTMILDSWGYPEVEKYGYDTLTIKQIMDLQFQLAGNLGFIATELSKFKGQAGLKKAQIDITSNYLYTDAKQYIQEELQERRTDKYIQSIIGNMLTETYANQRISAAIAVVLETIYRSGELCRNVLNSTAQYHIEGKNEIVNALHLKKSQNL